jgi:hypothetical protein
MTSLEKLKSVRERDLKKKKNNLHSVIATMKWNDDKNKKYYDK